MNLDVFIAVALVLAAADVFIIFLIKRLSSYAKRQIESNVLRQLNAYDELIEKKAQTYEPENIDPPAEDIIIEESEESPAETPRMLQKIPNYVDRSFISRYESIKSGFIFNKEEVIKNFCAENFSRDTESIYLDIYNKLDYDSLYKFMNIPKNNQLEALSEVLDTAEKEVLNEYLSMGAGFDIVRFKAYIKQLAKKHSDKIYVYSGKENENFSHINSNIITVYDAGICEGIVIVCKDKRYDYSIRKEEIS